MLAVFQNDDARFHDWRAGNPDAFVLNVPPLKPLTKPADPVLLHRAGCSRLKAPPGAAKVRHPYVCAEDRPALESWHAENRPRAPLAMCQYCARRAG